MKKIGLTGGIGAGKSLVAQIFEHIGIAVYNADSEAKRLMMEDSQLVLDIKKLFGNDAYLGDGTLNRIFISSQVFSNIDLLEKLNRLVHPAVAKDFNRWSENQESPYVIQEAAILFESHANKMMDQVVFVSASLETRIKRVMQRDLCSREEVQKRINNQWTEDRKMKLSDYIIQNEDCDLIVPQVITVHKSILNHV